jgi:hypothetical protein
MPGSGATKYGARREFISIPVLAFENSDTPTVAPMPADGLLRKPFLIKMIDKLKKIRANIPGKLVRLFIPMPILDKTF